MASGLAQIARDASGRQVIPRRAHAPPDRCGLRDGTLERSAALEIRI
jgi:hypothetical protein